MSDSNAYKAGISEIGLDLVPGLMPLAYVEGRMDAKVGKRPKELKCKPGFKQRGAACQRIKPKKVEVKAAAKGGTGGVGGAIGTALALTAAAAAGGAAVYLANRRQGEPQPPTPSLPPVLQKTMGNKALLAAGAGGVALGTAATLTIAHRQREQAVATERAAAEKEVAAVKRKAEEDLQAATKKIQDGHQNELSVANSRLNGVKSKLEEKEAELTSIRSEAAKTKGDLDAHKAVLEATRSELEKASEQVKSHQSELEQTKSELEQTKGAAKKYHSELDKTKNELSEKSKTVEESDQAIAKHRENLEKAAKQVEELTKKSTELESQVKNLESEVSATRSERDKANSQSATTQAEAAKAKRDLESHKAALKTTRSELTAASAQVEKYQTELDRAKSQLSEQEKLSTEKDKTIEASNQAISKHKEDLDKATKQVEELTHKYNSQTSKVKKLEAEAEELLRERNEYASAFGKLHDTLDDRVEQGVAAERKKLEHAQKMAIAKIDEEYSAKAVQTIISQTESVEDPKPGRGFQAARGDLLSNEKGIRLGASTRNGSNFINLSPDEQLTKLRNKVETEIEDVYADKAKILSKSFAETLLEIDKKTPTQVEKIQEGSGRRSPQEIASRTKEETEVLYENEYLKKPRETEKERSKRVKEELVKLGQLEKEIAKQGLREEALKRRKNQIAVLVIIKYREALEELHRSARNEAGEYDPSKVTPERLKAFDEKAKQIHAEFNQSLTDATNEALSVSYGATILKNAPKTEKRQNKKDETDSVNYLAGKLEASLAFKKNTRSRNDAQEANLYISALLTKVIQSVYPKVKSVTSARKNGSSLIGYFQDVEGVTFTFELSDNSKQIKIKPAVKKDSLRFDDDEKLNCKPGYEQMGAACKPIVVNKEVPPAVQSAARLVDKTIETGELPSRAEIAKELGVQARELLKNPVKAIKEGFEREKKFKEAYKNVTGKEAPTKAQAAATVAKKTAEYVKENPESVKEAALFVAGSAGGAIGTAVAGPAGGMAGDLAAPMVVRAAFTADEAARRAHAKLAKDEAFQKASKLEKLKKLGAATLDELKHPKMKDKIEDGVTDDVSGWVVGNAVGKTMEAVGVPDPITTAVATGAAMSASPKIAKAKDRIKAGENAVKVAKETAKEMVKEMAERKIKKGNEREAKMREKANKYIKRFTEPMRQARQASQ